MNVQTHVETVVWSYDMDAAPKDEYLVFSVRLSNRIDEMFGRYDDQRYNKKPKPFWSYFGWDTTFSRSYPPHAWRRVSPAPLPVNTDDV